jgi:hypothetical protein
MCRRHLHTSQMPHRQQQITAPTAQLRGSRRREPDGFPIERDGCGPTSRYEHIHGFAGYLDSRSLRGRDSGGCHSSNSAAHARSHVRAWIAT